MTLSKSWMALNQNRIQWPTLQRSEGGNRNLSLGYGDELRQSGLAERALKTAIGRRHLP